MKNKKIRNKVITLADVRPKSSDEQKKVNTPLDYPLYEYHIYFVHLCVGEGGRGPSALPLGYASHEFELNQCYLKFQCYKKFQLKLNNEL